MDLGDIDDELVVRPTATVRRTRALADLSRQMAGVSVTNVFTTPHFNNQTPTFMMTPAPSPDEMIIQLRGRKNPVTWSPLSINGVQKLAQYDITPPKDATPTRAMLGLRSSPRKRLQLTADTKETSTNTSPEKNKKILPNSSKRQKLEISGSPVPLNLALNPLSREQLLCIINDIALKHPELKRELESSLPEPDLHSILEKLTHLKKNLFKSLPNCRLSSKTDSAAYNKASIHLAEIKKSVLEYGKRLEDSQQWNSLIEYTIMAWDIVKATPNWDNMQHNAVKKQCFKALAISCYKALKNCEERGPEWSAQIKQRLERLKNDSEDMDSCVTYLNSMNDS